VVNAQGLGNPPARHLAKLSLRTTVRRKKDERENEAERKPLHLLSDGRNATAELQLADDASQRFDEMEEAIVLV
jgi:hypothetical protein